VCKAGRLPSAHRGQRFGVLRPELPGEHREGALIERLGLLVLAASSQQASEVVALKGKGGEKERPTSGAVARKSWEEESGDHA
jgi:hypothetical protein